MPYKVVAAIAQWLLARRRLEEAGIIVSSEAYAIRAADLVAPVNQLRQHRFWTVAPHAQETLRVSKTGVADKNLVLALLRRHSIGLSLARLLLVRVAPHRRSTSAVLMSDQPLLTGPVNDPNRTIADAVAALDLSRLRGAHAYQLRHGGASHDSARKARTLTAIIRRGRWATWGSLRRFEMGSRLIQLLRTPPPEL